jgi:succinyl-diaminopimelate desuccinylase
MTRLADPLALAQALIRCPSVTPADAGALDVLGAALQDLGFTVRRYRFGEVDNLFARLGPKSDRTFCFAGHTDVVPVGDQAAWSVDPFAGTVQDGWLIGRGAADMKAAIAAMVAACARLGDRGDTALAFLITGDEEGPALDGTVQLLKAITAEGETLSHCLVGEPTSVEILGDTVKNGRRGSLNAHVRVEGQQGHVAYPALAANPVGALLSFLGVLRARQLDTGAAGFQPSNLEVTSIDVGNPTHNVIPAAAEARLNIRFNTAHTGAGLLAWLDETAAATEAAHPGTRFRLTARATGEPFYTPPGPFTDLICAAARAQGAPGALSTSGGTSDARFIRAYCPVAELGLQNATAHMVDERVLVSDVHRLAGLYTDILEGYVRQGP